MVAMWCAVMWCDNALGPDCASALVDSSAICTPDATMVDDAHLDWKLAGSSAGEGVRASGDDAGSR